MMRCKPPPSQAAWELLRWCRHLHESSQTRYEPTLLRLQRRSPTCTSWSGRRSLWSLMASRTASSPPGSSTTSTTTASTRPTSATPAICWCWTAGEISVEVGRLLISSNLSHLTSIFTPSFIDGKARSDCRLMNWLASSTSRKGSHELGCVFDFWWKLVLLGLYRPNILVWMVKAIVILGWCGDIVIYVSFDVRNIITIHERDFVFVIYQWKTSTSGMKKSEPKIDPWGTPMLIGITLENVSCMCTHWALHLWLNHR